MYIQDIECCPLYRQRLQIACIIALGGMNENIQVSTLHTDQQTSHDYVCKELPLQQHIIRIASCEATYSGRQICPVFQALHQDRQWKGLMTVLQLAFCIIMHCLIAFRAPEAWCCRCNLVLIGYCCRIPDQADAAFLPPVGRLHMQRVLGMINTDAWQSSKDTLLTSAEWVLHVQQ